MTTSKKVTLIGLGTSRHDNPFLPGFFYVTSSSLHYLSCILTSRGFNVNIINQVVDDLSMDDMIQEINQHLPDIILFNQFFSTREQVKEISLKFRNSCIIGIGGHDISFHSKRLSSGELQLQYNHADFIWQGEAENNLADFLHKFKKREHVAIIDNLANRVLDLDSLPILKHNDYNSDKGFIVSSRGCHSNGCDFCTTPQFYKSGVQYRSIDHVEKELNNLARNGKRIVFVFDDNFLGFSKTDLLKSMKIIDKCKKLGLKLFVMTRVEQIVRASKLMILKEMTGTVFQVFLGVENGSTAVLRKIGKKCNPDSYRKTCEQAIEALRTDNIATYLGYINFYPESTYEELETSLDFLHENGQLTSIFHYLSNKLQLYEGTQLKEKYDLNLPETKYLDSQYLKYRFFEKGIGFLSSYLDNYVTPIVYLADFLEYETTFHIYLNQLQTDPIESDHLIMKKKLSEINFLFFKDALEISKDYPNISQIMKLKEEFIEKVKSVIFEYRLFLKQNVNEFKYVNQEAFNQLDQISLSDRRSLFCK